MKADLWTQLQNETRPIVLYGTGNAAERINEILKAKGIKISGVFASDSFVRNKIFDGLPVGSLSDIEKQFDDFVILLCFGSHLPEVISHIEEISKARELFAPDIPVIGEGIFDAEYFEAHEKDFQNLRELLADEKSKQVLDDTIAYKLSGKLSYLCDCETSDEEIWQITKAENLLDLGAYIGDTAELFLKINDGQGEVYACEPESRNFRKLSEFAANHANVHPLNFGIGDKLETVEFSKGSGRGSLSKKTIPVQFTTVDALGFDIPEEVKRDILVKMDLEGWEIRALDGARDFIKAYHPKMLIAGYHRLDDLLEIPNKVHTIDPSYKIYLRHSPCVPAWELNYGFI